MNQTPARVHKHVPSWPPIAGLAALSIALGACGAAGPSGRSITVGGDIALELDFDDPVVIAIETQSADARSWDAMGYVTMTRGTAKVAMDRPQDGGDLRFTLGVAGKLVDRADGSAIGDGGSVVVESRNPRAVDVREARITTQLQIARDTIATIGLDEAARTTMTTTRPFAR